TNISSRCKNRAHSRFGGHWCNYRQGWKHPERAPCFRTPVARTRSNGRGETVEIPALHTEWKSSGSRYADHGEFHTHVKLSGPQLLIKVKICAAAHRYRPCGASYFQNFSISDKQQLALEEKRGQTCRFGRAVCGDRFN